ncbi:MAG: hypothetical protein LIQ30_12335 [Planctomycetes bacterium]|nr:hypothetical protein [Planctomycetota bacterium]MCC8115673.1 hypothetical protein [Planctomycetota bacterium]MCD7897377.1 hypothetical protein [Planctomycetaceae bacterium]
MYMVFLRGILGKSFCKQKSQFVFTTLTEESKGRAGRAWKMPDADRVSVVQSWNFRKFAELEILFFLKKLMKMVEAGAGTGVKTAGRADYTG